MAETKAGADAAFDFFIEAYGVKYAKSCSKWRAAKCLIKDCTDLLAFHDFPGRALETHPDIEPDREHRSHRPAPDHQDQGLPQPTNGTGPSR